MNGTMITRGAIATVREDTPIYARLLNKDGTLGKEFKVPTGTVLQMKQFDFFRDGIFVCPMNSNNDYFIPFSTHLAGLTFGKLNNTAVVDAVYIGKLSLLELRCERLTWGLYLALGTFVGFALGVLLQVLAH